MSLKREIGFVLNGVETRATVPVDMSALAMIRAGSVTARPVRRRPKSMRTTWPSGRTMAFEGFRSRWIASWECSAWTAVASAAPHSPPMSA